MSGPWVPERGTGPTHARHTAGGPTTDIASPSMPDQPPGKTIVPPDYQSGQSDAVNTSVKNTTVVGLPATWRRPNREAKSPTAPNRLSEKVNDPVSCPTVGMARHCGPGSWIPRNSGSPLVRCPIARAVAGTRLKYTPSNARMLRFFGPSARLPARPLDGF